MVKQKFFAEKELKQELIELSKNVGFDLIGFCSPEIDNIVQSTFRSWLKNNYHADMKYMEETVDIRSDVKKLLPDVKTIIMFGLAYGKNYNLIFPPVYSLVEPLRTHRWKNENKKIDHQQSQTGDMLAPLGSGRFSLINPKISKTKKYGKVARYALNRDYHNTYRSMFKRFIRQSSEIFAKYGHKNVKIFGGSDSKPIPERYYAVKAGLGFIGNNGCLITKKYGSFVLLGALLVNVEIEYDKPSTGTCGVCKRCMQACPAKAIVAPRVIDSNRCISYWTIEHRGHFPKNVNIKDHLFGCDVCQEVCPYNKSLPPTPVLALDEILSISSKEEFFKRFAGTPFMRAKFEGMKRNAKYILTH